MFRCLPPTGQRIRFADVCNAISENRYQDFVLRDLSLKSPSFFVSSGTAALCLSLKAIGDNSSKQQVVLPAYTCPSLLAAVVKARLEPVLCDLILSCYQYSINYPIKPS
jgi:hypothetical protein